MSRQARYDAGVKIDRKFIERVATYLFGVAIGLILLGVIQMQRSNARQAQQAPQAVPAQPTGSGASHSGSAPPTNP